MTEPSGSSIQSVLNALRILEHVGAHQPVGVSQLAREVDLPKTSVQRALRTLADAGWLRPAGGDLTRWELTSRMLGIALTAFGEFSLRDHVEAAMHELRARTGETIHLVTLDDDSGLVIHRLDSLQSVRAYVQVGTRSPLHATASGQAILAFLPEARAKEIVSGTLPAFTDHTVTDSAAVLDRLTTVRERGYAVNVAEWRPEVASISAPILSRDGTAVAAMTISIPLSRYREDLVATYGGWAAELTRALGPVSPERR
ncbi:IclR family transcriptional regulator [Pseudonocardia pini]|uniref:IclR family transcriptional regulator n=1 Tax=Pseudonocardia pini TaxID=2758030 RepID=UPI0015F067FD|nr:IclR family transcriptional regulator [Pseudonocardia pini]